MARIIVTVYSLDQGPLEVEVEDFPEKTYAAGVRDGVLAYLQRTSQEYEFTKLTRQISS